MIRSSSPGHAFIPNQCKKDLGKRRKKTTGLLNRSLRSLQSTEPGGKPCFTRHDEPPNPTHGIPLLPSPIERTSKEPLREEPHLDDEIPLVDARPREAAVPHRRGPVSIHRGRNVSPADPAGVGGGRPEPSPRDGGDRKPWAIDRSAAESRWGWAAGGVAEEKGRGLHRQRSSASFIERFSFLSFHEKDGDFSPLGPWESLGITPGSSWTGWSHMSVDEEARAVSVRAGGF